MKAIILKPIGLIFMVAQVVNWGIVGILGGGVLSLVLLNETEHQKTRTRIKYLLSADAGYST